MITPRLWTADELERDLGSAISAFRRERLEEPLEQYLQAFDACEQVIGELLEATGDLARLGENALELLIDRRLAEAFRYLTGPIISRDDLKTTADAALSPSRLRADPAMVERIVTLIRTGMDRRRFAWLPENRDPSAIERHAAIVASAALMANSRVGTTRRNKGRLEQETAVLEALSRNGLKQVARRFMSTIHQAPKAGEFCLESHLGSAKADLVVSLWDSRVMPIECKVSNSAVNSVKRLNREAAAKAGGWTNDFGIRQVVPVAVLSGVYKLGNLMNAQERGLHLFWAHDLGALTSWIESTRQET